MRSIIVVMACVAGCQSTDSFFAQANLPRSFEFGGTGFQSYLATIVVPIGMSVEEDPRLPGGSFYSEGQRIHVFNGSFDLLGEWGACNAVHDADVSNVLREDLADGSIISCRQAGGLAVVRAIRVDDKVVVCDIENHVQASDTDLVIATNMAKSLSLSWHADNMAERFRFPCHGELLFGKNAAGKGTWTTHLQCPDAAKSTLP